MQVIQGHNAKTKTYKRVALREPEYYSANISFPREISAKKVSPQRATVRDLSVETLTVRDLAAKPPEVRSGGRQKKWKIQELFSSDQEEMGSGKGD